MSKRRFPSDYKCQCKDKIPTHRKRGPQSLEVCEGCGGRISFAAMTFDFDRIDWDEEQFPAGAPYAGRTYKDVAAIDPAFVRFYASAVPSRVQRDIAQRAIRELHL